ncbi:hypothetical protein D3C86_2135310 [compost metagenome]
MRCIAQPLFGDFKLILCQSRPRIAGRVNELVRNHIATVSARLYLAYDYGINTQRSPCSRLHFGDRGRLLG